MHSDEPLQSLLNLSLLLLLETPRDEPTRATEELEAARDLWRFVYLIILVLARRHLPSLSRWILIQTELSSAHSSSVGRLC